MLSAFRTGTGSRKRLGSASFKYGSRKRSRTVYNKPIYKRSNENLPMVSWSAAAPITRNLSRKSSFPDTFLTTLTYLESVDTWDPGATGYKDWVYRGNGVYDPSFTGVGQTSISLPIFNTIYWKYRVLSSKVTWEGHQDTGVTEYVDMYLVPHSRSTGLASELGAASLPGCVTCKLTPDGMEHAMVSKARTADVLGYGRRSANDLDLCAVPNADPTTQWFWHVIVRNSAASDVNVIGRIKIEYTVIFSELREQGV